MLKLENVYKTFFPGSPNEKKALQGVSFTLEDGDFATVIGSNGAGKTTLVNSIVGIVKSSSGTITFDGKDITHVPAHAMTKEGIGISPEGREVFPELTVEENLRIGAFVVKDENKIKESYERVYELFPRLKERTGQRAGTLSGGEQQMLAMGRALMSKPRLIVMDEPSMGLSPIFVNEIFDIIRVVSESGTTVLLVEQNAKKALSIADRAYVLETGKITMSGNASDLLNDEAVQKAYLGE